MLVEFFIMFYLDGRNSIFLLQDWKVTMNFFSLLSIFVFSGLQRTVTVLRFRLHQKSSGKERGRTEEEQKDLKPYSGWKITMILYELAMTLTIF